MTMRITPALPRLAALVALLGAAAGCEATPPPPPPLSATAGGARSAAAAAAPASGPVTQFDGRYSGKITLNPDRTRRCTAAPDTPLELTVRQGRGAFVVDPVTRQTLAGMVGRDGDVRLTDPLDRSIATEGLFNAQGFVGTYRNGLCTYAVTLRRDGP